MLARSFTLSACLLLIVAPLCIPADFTVVSAARHLRAADIGKVFVKPDQPPHPNFGKYLVLTDVDGTLYGFDTFNFEDGKPIGKFHVSYFASPLFREVAIDRETMKLVKVAIKEADDAHERSLEGFRQEMEALRRARTSDENAKPPPNKSLERTRER